MKFFLLLLIFLFSPHSSSREIYMVINGKVSEDAIKTKTIQSIFLKKKQYWSDGSKVRPIDQTLGTQAREQFLRKIIKKSEIELSEYWIEQKQVNGLVQPIQLDNNQMVFQLVRSLSGSIGYIFEDKIEDLDTQNLRIQKVTD